jgi:hypothetical protein
MLVVQEGAARDAPVTTPDQYHHAPAQASATAQAVLLLRKLAQDSARACCLLRSVSHAVQDEVKPRRIGQFLQRTLYHFCTAAGVVETIGGKPNATVRIHVASLSDR